MKGVRIDEVDEVDEEDDEEVAEQVSSKGATRFGEVQFIPTATNLRARFWQSEINDRTVSANVSPDEICVSLLHEKDTQNGILLLDSSISSITANASINSGIVSIAKRSGLLSISI